ncbi:MAG: pyridoxal-phosphate dependent enzyme [Actinobacteria bacterium]|nr:pyridoxal-phosphate dependent enzyme [Actinomycetota bacterium]
MAVSIDDVEAVRARVADVAVVTPTVPTATLSERVGTQVSLKLESIQPTGSFKVRGAASKIASLDANTAARGVVTASTGNHGRAVAHVARSLGIPATVCVSHNVPPGKVRALRALGCDLAVGGHSQTDGLAAAEALVADRGMTLVHPFDDRAVIAGQGTIGVEIAEQRSDVGTVVVPLSGGGLISGVAVAVKARCPWARVIGVSMERGAVMAASLSAGHPVELDEEPTLADSLQGGIGTDNRYTLAITQALVDDVVLVTEQQIWDAMRFVLHHHRVVLEGGGAVGVAALLAGRLAAPGPVVVVASGANAEDAQIAALAGAADAPPT